MEDDLSRVFEALEQSGAKYLVVGGVAVVLHGHPRFTADVDLVVALEPANVRAVLGAIAGLAYRPRAPVNVADCADPKIRASWVEEKGLTVFAFWSPLMPATEIDLFVEEPFPFADGYARAVNVKLGSLTVSVASIDDLVAMKRVAGRPRDIEDVAALEAIRLGRARGER